jgi:hypothetical protein
MKIPTTSSQLTSIWPSYVQELIVNFKKDFQEPRAQNCPTSEKELPARTIR